MSLKNLMVGSCVLIAILVIFSMAANNVVDNTLNATPQADSQTTVNGQQMKGDLPQGKVSLSDVENNPSMLKSLTEKMMQSVIQAVDAQANSNQSDSKLTYDQLMQDYPLTDEELAQIEKYSGNKSPAELIQAYCEDSQSEEFDQMISDVKNSYGNDPNSPAMLMDLYSAMSKLCPDQQ
jgi:hypothetical protein